MVEEEDMAGVEADLTDPIVVMLEMVLIIHLIQIQAPEIKNIQRGMATVIDQDLMISIQRTI
jgi:hypothetical protein